MARPVAIQGDAVWLRMMLQCLAKECLRCSNAACSTQIELHGVALSIHGAVQIHPLAPNLDERFIDSPAPSYRSLESAPALFARFGIANHPTQDCGVRNRQAPLTKNHDQIPVAEFEAKIPAKAEENDVVFEPTSGK